MTDHNNNLNQRSDEWWDRVSEALEKAVEMPTVSRDTFLTSLEVGLRREVESLLGAHEGQQGRFDEPALAAITGVIDAPENAQFRPGDSVGPYRIMREVGRGGMGSVFEAYRVDDDFRKRVAIKTINTFRSHPGIIDRFRRERRILARLEHRNIAALFDGGITADGAPYFAMEFVEGQALDEYCQSHSKSLRNRLQLLRQTCGAVHFAHQKLVVHRDIKPGNIMVTADGTVKLLDFGIAKVFSADDDTTDNPQDQTALDGGPFTLAYASPEQIRGEPVSTASDVYALGIVLFKVITNSHPFRTASISQEQLRTKILNDGTPPSGFGADVDAIIRRATHKDPARRYSSAEQLAEDLRRLDSGMPLIARPDSFGYRASRFIKRNRTTVGAGVLAVVALITAAGVSRYQARVASAERDRARVEATKAVRVTQFVQDMLRSADPRNENANLKVVDALASASLRADSALSGEPEILASVQTTIGLSYLSLGRYQEAEPLLQHALVLRKALGANAQTEIAASLRHLATLHSERGELAPAESLFTLSLTSYRALTTPDSAGLADVLNALADLEQYKGDLDLAASMQREALAIRQRLDGPTSESVAASLNNYAVIQGQRGRWVEAESLTKSAIAIIRAKRGNEHPDVASGLNSLAFEMQSQGRVAAAESLYREALRIRVKTLGADHPETARTHMNLGWLLHDSERYAGAVTEASQVLALRKSLGDDHPAVGSTLILKGQSLLKLNKLDEGEQNLRDALHIREAALPAGHWLIAASRSAVGEALALHGKFSDAEKMLLPAFEILKKERGENAELSVLARKRLVTLYTKWGKPTEANKFRSAK